MGFLDEIIDKDLAVKHIRQGSDEWDEVRCGRFTASEIFKLMDSGTRDMTQEELKARPKTGTGSSAKKTIDYSKLSSAAETYIKIKVAETLTGRVKSTGYAFPIVYGKELESEAVEYFEKITGNRTDEAGFIPFGNHAGGSPDRFVNEDEGLEIKCPYTSEMQIDYLMLTDRYDLKRCFPEYYWQVMSNLLFTGKSKWHFCTYDPRFVLDKHKMTHLVIEPVEADFNLIIMKLELSIEEKLKTLKILGWTM